jgi:hypothetical protein
LTSSPAASSSVAWVCRRSCSRITGSISSPTALRRLELVLDEQPGEPLGVTMAAVEGAEHQSGVPHEAQRH